MDIDSDRMKGADKSLSIGLISFLVDTGSMKTCLVETAKEDKAK